MREDARHYSIEIRDVATGAIVISTTAEWTEQELQAAIAQILRLEGPHSGLLTPRDPGAV
jgi:hypothetical protein